MQNQSRVDIMKYNKMKVKVLFLITVVLVIIVSYFAFISTQKSSRLATPISQNQNNTKTSSPEISLKTKEYIDPSGFKFSYPDNLKLEVIDKKDPAYYSSLKLSSADTEGYITLEVTTSKYNSLDDWVKNNKELSRDSKETKLAELPAKVIYSDEKRIIIAVDIETLFTIAASYQRKNQEYWDKATDKMVESFAFELPDSQTETTNTVSTDEDVVFEGEEVIE